MRTTTKPLRVLIVDDNRDGADTLGLLVEELGNQVHVTYGGTNALKVATTFRPDLMLVDLVMPGMDGCDLVTRLREVPDFAHTQIVAITGLKDDEYKTLARKSGCDAVLVKPIALTDIKSVLTSVASTIAQTGRSPARAKEPPSGGTEGRLPIEEARRIRSERKSKRLTQAESEAAICDGITRFQEEYLGGSSRQIRVHMLKDLLVVRIVGALTVAERKLGESSAPGKGRDLIKQARKQLLELARPMMESLVHEAVGVKVLSMHHDISTVTGEELVIFSLAAAPHFQ
jgi:CheY-like chemotaxis protein